MKLTQIALTGSFLLVLAACGNNSPVKPPTDPNPPTNPGGGLPGGIPGFPGGGTPTIPAGDGISGTVTAPAGGDVSNTVVLACPNGSCDDPATQNVVVDTSGAYSFTGLSTTTQYGVFAYKDNTGSDTLANGDYYGFYTTDGTQPAPVTPPQTGINITMTVYSDGSGTNTPPEAPGTAGGSISGTLIPPGTVTGISAAYACYPTGDQNNPCDKTLSKVVEAPASSNFAYNLDNLTAGQYLVLGLADVDGNQMFSDATDYIGAYPSLDAPEAVSPPDTGIDIPLVPLSTLSGSSVKSSAKSTKVLDAARTSFNNYLLKKQLEQALKILH